MSRPALKSQSDYPPLNAPSEPGPKNGHLSEPDPMFVAVRPQLDAYHARVWQQTEWPPFRALWDIPPQQPPDFPVAGKDVLTELRRVPVRDGADVEVKIYRSAQAGSGPAAMVLKMHSGGWSAGTHGLEELDNLRAGALPDVVVVSIDYRLAPEHPFPIPLQDCFDVLIWSQENASLLGIDPGRIILAGSSAGGNLTAALALMARDAGVQGIVGQVLNCPATCHPKFFSSLAHQYELLSYQQNHDASIIDALKMEFFWDHYVGTDPTPNPLHSPLLCKDLSGLPPTFIQVSGADPLRDEAIAYAEALEAAGNDVSLHAFKGLPHMFSSFMLPHPDTKASWEAQDGFIQRVAGQESHDAT